MHGENNEIIDANFSFQSLYEVKLRFMNLTSRIHVYSRKSVIQTRWDQRGLRRSEMFKKLN